MLIRQNTQNIYYIIFRYVKFYQKTNIKLFQLYYVKVCMWHTHLDPESDLISLRGMNQSVKS